MQNFTTSSGSHRAEVGQAIHPGMLGRCLLLLALCGTATDGACVCQEQHLCNPLTTPPPAKEVYAFALQGRAGLPNSTVADQWRSFRWDLVTSVAWDVGANETVCWAHKHGVRVIIPVGAGLPTATARRPPRTLT